MAGLDTCIAIEHMFLFESSSSDLLFMSISPAVASVSSRTTLSSPSDFFLEFLNNTLRSLSRFLLLGDLRGRRGGGEEGVGL